MTPSSIADIVVVIHFLWVLGVIVPTPLIVAGKFLKWRWIHNLWFRRIHLAMIAFVAFESAVGVLCPLTVIEQQLRSTANKSSYTGSFVEHWVHELIFYDFAPWVFTTAYLAFLAFVITLYVLIPPQKKKL